MKSPLIIATDEESRCTELHRVKTPEALQKRMTIFQGLGSTRVSRVGLGVSPEPSECSRRDAESCTRDACAPRTLDNQTTQTNQAEANSGVLDTERIKPSAWFVSRAAVVTALGLACWPVARWYVARISDGSDEPWGLAALASAVLFAPRTGWNEPLTRNCTWLLCGLVALYTASYAFLPPLGHALLFVTALGIAVGRRGFPLAWWSLLVLSLPLVATLQFYLGYPLRLAATALCVPLLWLGGLRVVAEGTALHWAGETVIVDAPCSGIHMLWTGLFLAAALACWQRLDLRQTFRLLRRASLAVFVANVLRATALFCIESKLWPSPSWAHEGVGLLLFGAAAMTIFWASEMGGPAVSLPPVSS